MKYPSNPIQFRIAWCQRQRAKAGTATEAEGWYAEEEGLKDALLHRNHMNHYQLAPPEVLERYMMGLQDGDALMRAGCGRSDYRCR